MRVSRSDIDKLSVEDIFHEMNELSVYCYEFSVFGSFYVYDKDGKKDPNDNLEDIGGMSCDIQFLLNELAKRLNIKFVRCNGDVK